MIKVIIFDLDGLLIDSQPLQYEAYNSVFSKYGAPMSLKDWYSWVHKGWHSKNWIEKNNLSLQADKIRDEKKKIYDKLVRDKLQFKPGAFNLINKLQKNYRLCVASSSRIESIRLALDKFKIIPKFEKILSDTEMQRGKPHPDIFLKTAQLMNVKPSECVVIEDSVAGLKAAKAAGMRCIICPDTFIHVDPSEFKGAYKIVETLDEVIFGMIEE